MSFLLRDLRDRLGLAYLFISHDIGVIAHIVDRVVVMYRGRAVEVAATAEVLRPPKFIERLACHNTIAELAEASPQLQAAK
jgi:ABC-type glutathione transport system ATPase component